MDLESRPSAPLYPAIAHAGSGETLLSIHQSSSSAPQVEKGLVKDVIKKAHGDSGLANAWLDTLSGRPAGFERLEDLDVAAADAGAPGTFFCPISYAIMRDPVLLSTGQTFDRHSIAEWLTRGHNTCPSTGQVLEHPVVLTPNHVLRKCIEEWAETNALWLLGPDGHIKPVPEAERIASIRRPVHRNTVDSDLALAVRLQEEELSFASAQRPPTPSPRPQDWRQRSAQPPAASRPRGRRRASTKRTWPLRLVLYLMTFGPLVLCVLSFWQNGWQVENLHDNPLIGAGAPALRRLGSKASDSIVQPKNQWWRFLSSAFLPSGVLTLFAMVESLWTFALHLDPVLLGPSALCIPFIYLISAIVGGLGSANLAPSLDACGASAGVCGLLGFVWIEQLVNWRAYRHHLVTVVILAVNTALFIILGFLPLLDNFYHILAMGTGALLAPALLRPEASCKQHAGRPGAVQRGQSRRRCGCMRCTTAILGLAGLAALLAIGVVGLAVKHADVGKTCGWCNDFACIDTRWWDCQPRLDDTGAPSCVYTPTNNGSATVQCPGGISTVIPAPSNVAPNSSSLVSICNTYCNTVTLGPRSSSAPPPPSTTVIRAGGP